MHSSFVSQCCSYLQKTLHWANFSSFSQIISIFYKSWAALDSSAPNSGPSGVPLKCFVKFERATPNCSDLSEFPLTVCNRNENPKNWANSQRGSVEKWRTDLLAPRESTFRGLAPNIELGNIGENQLSKLSSFILAALQGPLPFWRGFSQFLWAAHNKETRKSSSINSLSSGPASWETWSWSFSQQHSVLTQTEWTGKTWKVEVKKRKLHKRKQKSGAV